jgi:hypothetical protein
MVINPQQRLKLTHECLLCGRITQQRVERGIEELCKAARRALESADPLKHVRGSPGRRGTAGILLDLSLEAGIGNSEQFT